MVLLWRGGYSGKVQWTLGLVVIGGWLITALVLRERVVRPLQTLSNMLAALREGDYSIRARGAERDDALGLAFLESNLLGETLRTQRLGAMEATALLRTVMAEIDVAVFAFDDDGRVAAGESRRRAAARAVGRAAARPHGRAGRARRIALTARRRARWTSRFPAAPGAGRCGAGSFRQDGRPHTLLVLADVSRDAARRGAAGVAAAGPRAEPRDQQLARADQVDHGQSGDAARSASRGRRMRTTICGAGSR